MKRYFKNLILIFLLTAALLIHPASYAWAEYVLPYPSYMPGNKLYRVSLLLDQLKVFWYWGNIASTKYHLQLADKYLVEAKTLCEYGQYFLAVKALERSDKQFKLAPQFLEKARKEGKDISRLKEVVRQATNKHVSVLTKLRLELPAEFIWTPEKEKPTRLDLWGIMDQSIQIRRGIL